MNYKGRPWAKGLDENTGLLWSMAISVVLAFVLSVEALPMLNSWLELVPFPTAEFRYAIFTALAMDIVGAFVWDRLCLFVFAFDAFRASMAEMTRAKAFALFRTFAVAGVILYFLVTTGEELSKNEEFMKAWEEAMAELEEGADEL